MGFLYKPVRHQSITLRFEPFRFWLQIRGDIRNQKTTLGLAESGSRQECLQIQFFFKSFNKLMVTVHNIPGFFLPNCSFKGLVQPFKVQKIMLKSLTRQVGESMTPRLVEFYFKHSKADSPTRRLGSRFSIMNISVNYKPKAEQLERQCKGSMRNQFLQNTPKICLIVMSL